MRFDPKFGWHSVWIVPVIYIYICIEKFQERIDQIYRNIKIRYILYRNPELKLLQKRAGIKNE